MKEINVHITGYAMGLPDMCYFASNYLIQFPIVNKIIRYMEIIKLYAVIYLVCFGVDVYRFIWEHQRDIFTAAWPE